MVLDGGRLEAPDPAGIFEVADQFFLFGIHADNGQRAAQKALFLPGDALELSIALWMRCGKGFGVGVQGITQLIEQASYGRRTHYDIQLPQFVGDLAKSFARPQTASARGIAGGILLEQTGEGLQEAGRFFSTRGRPPPG